MKIFHFLVLLFGCISLVACKQDQNNFIGLDEIDHHRFQKCHKELVHHIESYISLNTKKALLSCIEHDFNNDSKQDFLLKLESDDFCEDDFCQTYLFVQKNEEGYQKLDGPPIRGNEVATPKNKDGNFKNLFLGEVLQRVLGNGNKASTKIMCVLLRVAQKKKTLIN